MNQITWTDDYSVGNKLLDKQHKQLVTILNYLIRLSESPDLTTHIDSISEHGDSISNALSMLTNFAKGHFKTEELIFSKTDYPKINEHKKQHAEFEEYVAEFRLSLTKGDEHKSDELLTYVSDWLNNHILIEDMEFKPYLSESRKVNS